MKVKDVIKKLKELPKNSNINLDQLEKEIISVALQRNNNHRIKSAKDIGMGERTFYRRLKEYGL